jgi:anti-anti-sigma regulatory factor
MLKIRRSEDEGKGCTIFSLSGRIEEKDVSEIQKLFEAEAQVADITLDLEEVRLVDRGAVRYLAACEARGIKLENCPSYIREWIETGSDTNHGPQG